MIVIEIAYTSESSEFAALVLPVDLVFCSRPGLMIACEAKVDTGSDISVVPRALVKRHNPVPVGSFYIRQTGREERSYLVDAKVAGKPYHVEATLHDQKYMLVGRDILNQLTLVADGPRQKFQLIHSR